MNADDAVPAEIRLYEQLLTTDVADKDEFLDNLNPDSLAVKTAQAEPLLKYAKPGDKFQFMRVGYFCADYDHTPEKPVFNRIVELKDSWKG